MYSSKSDTLQLKYLHSLFIVFKLIFKFFEFLNFEIVELPNPVCFEISSAVVLFCQIKSSNLIIIIT